MFYMHNQLNALSSQYIQTHNVSFWTHMMSTTANYYSFRDELQLLLSVKSQMKKKETVIFSYHFVIKSYRDMKMCCFLFLKLRDWKFCYVINFLLWFKFLHFSPSLSIWCDLPIVIKSYICIKPTACVNEHAWYKYIAYSRVFLQSIYTK